MKNLNFLDKLVFLINSVVSLLLLLSYGLSYVPPKTFSFLSVLSLSVPVLIILNMAFAVYWLIKLKKQLLLSLLVLALGYNYIVSFYKFSSQNVTKKTYMFGFVVFIFKIINNIIGVDLSFLKSNLRGVLSKFFREVFLIL